MDEKDQGELFGPAKPEAAEPTGKAKGGHARAEKLTAERKAEIASKAAKARWSAPTPPDPEPGKVRDLTTVHYLPDESTDISLGFDATGQGIWATQEQIAELFSVNQSSISRHLRNVFESKELDETINMQKVHIDRSKKPVTVYSLDAIISVGYRVNSLVATRFRQWATQTLTTYVQQGYVLNDKLLREHPEKLNQLAAEVRALRSSEKHIYAKVRECFKVSASDYDPSSQEVRTFYALLQDKFHHAVTLMTSSKLILDRANHQNENMGIQSFAGEVPTKGEAIVGKNYLSSDELYRLHLLCEQFLLFAESTALAGRKMTMATLHEQLDRLLELNEYPLLDGYKDFLREEAVAHADRELKFFKIKRKLEAAGIKYSLEDLEYGEYDHMLSDDEKLKTLAPSPFEDD